MIKRPVKFIFATVAVLLVVVSLAVAAGYWRLSRGPVSLSVLVGTIESIINDNLDGLTVAVEDVVLEKDTDSGSVHLRLIDLRVFDQNKKTVARTSRAAFRVSMDDLVDGKFLPSHMELLGPRMFLHRRTDGSFELGFGVIDALGAAPADKKTGAENNTAEATGETAPAHSNSIESAEDMIALLQASLLSDKQTGPAARLREIKIIDASLTLYDEPNSTTWFSPKANIVLTREKEGLTASVEARIKIGHDSFDLDVQLAYSKSTRRISANVAAQDVNPETLARHVPDLEMLKVLHLPISGTASADIALDGKILNAGLDIKLGAGKLVFSEKQVGEIGVNSGQISLKYNEEKRLLVIEPSLISLSGGEASLAGFLVPEGDRGNPFAHFGYNLELGNIKIVGKKTIEIDRLIAIGNVDVDNSRIDLETTEIHAGDARISLMGMIKAGEKFPVVALSGNIDHIHTTKLLEIWPLEVARGLRVWISENLKAFVPRGSFKIDLSEGDIAKLVDGSKIPKDFLTAEFEVIDATVRYFEGLPPLKQAFGKGELKDGDFNFYGQGGVVTVASGKKIRLNTAHFHTNWAISDPAIGKIRANIKGSASAVMELLDNDPLNFAQKMGVNAKTMGGKVVGDLRFTLPLLAYLPVEKVDIKAQAKLTGITLPKAFGGYDLTRGNLVLDVTKFGLKGKGSVHLNDTKSSLAWVENFGVRGKRSSIFTLETILDDAARKRMGIELSNFMRGSARVKIVLKGSGSDLSEAHVEAALTKATLFRESISWRSPPGKKTTASLDIKFIKGGAVEIKNIKVVGKTRNVFVTGALQISANDRVTAFSLTDVRLGRRHRYSVSGKRDANGVLNVVVKGASIDARDIIANALKRERKPPSSRKNKNRDTIRVTAHFDTVYAHNKQVFKNLTAEITSIGDSVVALKSTAKINGTKSFSLNYGDKAGEKYNLQIASNDAGAMLKAFNLYSKIVKGKLELKAKISPPGSARPSEGYLKIKKFDIDDDDRLKGLTQTVVTDDDEFEVIFKESVAFSSFRMPFKLVKDQLIIGNSILKGAILGASGRGVLNIKNNGLNINGTLIPIYAVNSFIGKIPLLGRLLVGRKGEGLFGVTFTLRGTTDSPKFSINPVSALAPGFLRQFFEKGTPVPEVTGTPASGPVLLQRKRKKKNPVIVESSEN